MLELAQPDRSSMVTVNRTELRIWEWGDPASQPIVLAHGAFDHGRMWDEMAPHLAAMGFRVVAPDLRGHGDSGRLSSGHTWGAASLDLGFLIRDLGGQVGLIGHSMGAGMAMFAAAAWPEAVPWVVVLDGLGTPPEAFAERDLAETAAAAFTALDRISARSPRVYETTHEMVERRAGVNHRLPRPWVEHLVEHGSRKVEGGYLWKADPMFNIGFPGPFRAEHLKAEHAMVTSPLLVLTGGELDTWSDLTDEMLAERLAAFSDCRHEVIAGAGHYVHIEQPKACLESIERFLSQVRA